jgi:hypothetical protein
MSASLPLLVPSVVVAAQVGRPVPDGWLSMTIAVGSIVTMLLGLWFVFGRLRAKEQGFGANSLKAIGLVLFLPSLVLIAVQRESFQTETLAALLGTVAGYVLSHSKADDS